MKTISNQNEPPFLIHRGISNPWPSILDIKPAFIGNTAFCSCGITTEDKSFGNCPQWRKCANGNYKSNYMCQYGHGVHDGGMGGMVCTPFYQYLQHAAEIQAKMIEIRMDAIKTESNKEMKMINPKSGHGYGGLALIPIFIIGLFLGWPVVLPVFKMMEVFGLNTSDEINMLVLGLSTIPGFYIQCWVFSSVWKWISK